MALDQFAASFNLPAQANLLSQGVVPSPRPNSVAEARAKLQAYTAQIAAQSIGLAPFVEALPREECVTTDEFWAVMCEPGFVRTNLLHGQVGKVTYTCLTPPELVPGYIASKLVGVDVTITVRPMV